MNRFRRVGAIALVLVSSVLSGCIKLNEPPVASFTRAPDAGEAPLSVYFDAGDSLDTDGFLVTYTWAFGDGETGAGIATTHTYEAAGTYQATLTVTDNEGAQSTSTRAVSVVDLGVLPESGTEIGEQAPLFSLKSLEGADVALEAYRGLVVILDFWRSTCPPCLTTMPHLESLRGKYAENGLVVVTVSLDESEAAAREYLETQGLTEFVVLWGSLADATAVRSLYDVERIPHTFLIDRQGIIRYADHPIRLRDYHIEPWL